MKTSNLNINHLSSAGYAWYLDYLDALDAKDIERYGSFLADNCTMQINNAEVMTGKAVILGALSQYWQSFGRLEHDLLNLYGTDTVFMLEALNHYERLDGQAVTLRAVALTDRNVAGEVTSVRLYSDTSVLFT